MPKFSIIIPCYNVQSTISETLASLKDQTLKDWEVICVDDGSTDQTCAMINFEARFDPRIRLIANTGKGPSAARNLGALQEATGNLVAFCDADDLWLPTKLDELWAAFADSAVDGVFGQIGFFQDTPKDAHVYSTVPHEKLSIDMLLGENPVCTMSNFAIRATAFAQSEGFDVGMVHNEDLEWLIRIVGQGFNVIGLSSLQTWYRTSIGGLSTDLDAMLAGRSQALRTAERFGVKPSKKSNAVHHRYLARRALRLGVGRTEALQHALKGIAYSPVGFLTPFRRGALIAAGAASALVLPPAITRNLFS